MVDNTAKYPKIGLVIQGPMISTGRPGKSAYVCDKDIKPGDIVDYNCHDNIRRIVKNYGELFSSICLATWSGALEGEFAGLDVLEFDDTTPEVRIDPKQKPASINSKNKYRQFFLCYQGSKHLREKYQPDYIIKMRTDQFINLEQLCHYILDAAKKEDNFNQHVLIPFIPTQFTLLPDFYYAGETGMMESFFYSLISHEYFEFYIDIKLEISLKFARNVLFDRVNVPGYGYFPKTYKNFPPRKTAEILFYLYKNVYRPLPQELHKTTVWRGETYREDLHKEWRKYRIFSEDLASFDTTPPQPAWAEQCHHSFKDLLTAYDHVRWLKFEMKEK